MTRRNTRVTAGHLQPSVTPPPRDDHRSPSRTAVLAGIALVVHLAALAGPGAQQAAAHIVPAPVPASTPRFPTQTARTPANGDDLLNTSGTFVDPGATATTLPSSVTADSWVVTDPDTGAVLAARDPHRPIRPASTLKTLTALVLLPVLDPAGTTLYSAAAGHARQPDGVSTLIGLQPGHRYPTGGLLAAMLATSANDAAEALAEAGPGGRAGTLDAMNREAAKLGADDTHASTPSGLDAPGQWSSAYDIAVIACAAVLTPAFLTYDTAPTVSLKGPHGPFGGSNHNRLLGRYRGAYAGKDGYTSLAGQVWWGAARRSGHPLLVVVAGAADPVGDERALLDWGFAVRDGTAGTVQLGVPMDAGRASPAGGSLVPRGGPPPLDSNISARPARPFADHRSRGASTALLLAVLVTAVVVLIGGRRRARRHRRAALRRGRRPSRSHTYQRR